MHRTSFCLYRAGDIPQSPPFCALSHHHQKFPFKLHNLALLHCPRQNRKPTLAPCACQAHYTLSFSLYLDYTASSLFLSLPRPCPLRALRKTMQWDKCPAALQALQNGPAYDSFLKRWKLSVYFSLRFQVSHSSDSRQRRCCLCF